MSGPPNAHSQEHRAWLEAALGDEPIDARRRAELERCEHCGPLLREGQALVEALRTVAREDRDVLDTARALDDAPGLIAVRAEAERLRREPARPALARARPRTSMAPRLWIAAAVLLAGFVGWRVWLGAGSARGDRDVVLGDGDVALVAPLGKVGHYARFAWTSTLPPGGWFLLVVRDARSSDPSAAPLLEQRTQTPSLDVPAQVAASWPAEIEWEVRVYAPGPRLVGSASASASRSP